MLTKGSSLRRLFSTTTATVLKPDVCIIGAGPAGASLACALASSDHFNQRGDSQKRILLVDPSRLPQMSTYNEPNRMPEPRVVTLSPASLRLLKSVDALQACNHQYITPFTDMLVYEQAGSAYMSFNNKHDSPLVQAQKSLMNLWMSPDAQDKFQESDHSMGASIEN